MPPLAGVIAPGVPAAGVPSSLSTNDPDTVSDLSTVSSTRLVPSLLAVTAADAVASALISVTRASSVAALVTVYSAVSPSPTLYVTLSPAPMVTPLRSMVTVPPLAGVIAPGVPAAGVPTSPG